MIGLKRRTGIVCVQPYGVIFPMRAGSKTDITCVQTLAGFDKILGRKSYRQKDLQKLFRDNREAFDFDAAAHPERKRWEGCSR